MIYKENLLKNNVVKISIMKIRILTVLLVLFITVSMKEGEKPSYRIFKYEGKESSWKQLLNDAKEADIIFFGEQHDNAICHWLELELTRDMFQEKNRDLILGAEMFEADDQLILDEYLRGFYKTKNFEDDAKLWPNYKTDYKPLVEFAKEKKLGFIGTNIPRRYASVVNKGGFEALDTLSAEAKKYIAPLPIVYDTNVACYKSMLSMEGAGGAHATPNLPKAQAIKDATMAYFIAQNLKAGQVMIHYNGSYHSDNYEGIIWYLKRSNPNLKILTISAVSQESTDELKEESNKLADYIICIPETMTKTY